MKDKQARFVSHKEFLTRCVAEELVLKGLEVALEPTIGNHDQKFLDNWYSKQKQFLLSLMKDIVQFCEKKKLKCTRHQKSRKFSKDEDENEDSTRNVLQQRKFKKYNNLKYRPKSTNQTRVQEEQEDLPHDKMEKRYILTY